jgi:hypothetical protein
MKVCPMKCKKHPKYQAKHMPRARCEDCWRIWIAKQDKTPELATVRVEPYRRRADIRHDLQSQWTNASDRRDWDECDRLERELGNVSHGVTCNKGGIF